MSETTVRINDHIINRVEKYVNHEKTRKGAIEYGLKAYIELKRHSLESIKEWFTSSELIAMADVFNGILLNPREGTMKLMIIANIEDGENLDGTLSKWEVDLNQLKRKINELHPAELFYLMDAISNFWYQDGSLDIRKWAEEFNK